jgi:CRP-like cAMP-binding protein
MTDVLAESAAADGDPSEARLGNRLLAALGDDDFGTLWPFLRRTRLERGETLFEPGDDVSSSVLPGHGAMVSLLIATASGEEVEAATIGREGAVGGIISAGHRPAFSRAVVTLPGVGWRLPISKLEDAKRRSPPVDDLFHRYADALLAQVMQSVACNALHSVEQRAARWLLAALDRAEAPTFHLTQQALADMLGVQRTTVTAVLAQLQSKGVIEYRRANVTVADRHGLQIAACHCHRAVQAHFDRVLPVATAR